MSDATFEYTRVGDVSTPWSMGHLVVRHLPSGQSCTLTRRPQLPQDGPLFKSIQRAAMRTAE